MEPTLETTAIEGLLVLRLPVHSDHRGWFKEGWQRRRMTALGLPDFGPVQLNVAHNAAAGTTRGVHAEPWDKLVGLASGRIFGAWVDLREGPGFGTVVTLELGTDTAVFVPRGVGNAYQALADGTVYSYLVNDHWSPEARDRYTHVNLLDPALAIGWPVPVDPSSLSEADRHHPPLVDVVPFRRPRPVVVGADGQLGRALLAARPGAVAVDRSRLDITDADAVAEFDFSGASAIINAAAWTDVDGAETAEGRRAAWRANVDGVANLVRAARSHRIPLVQVSSDYVLDGVAETHADDEAPAPLGVYGQTKAAAEHLVATLDRHYVVRTSWLIGEGRNFVRTMARLADEGASPAVVDDQHGRLTFATDLAVGIWHLLDVAAPFGTYNLTNSGPTTTWADVARRVFELRGRDPDDVTGCSTGEWAADRIVAPRPRHSTLDLSKLEATGFSTPPADDRLREMLAG